MIKNEKYLVAYFGPQADYYLPKYNDFHSGKRFSFNMGPFFLGTLWFLYRKLWSEAIIIILSQVLIGLLEGHFYPKMGVTRDMQFIIMMGSTTLFGVLFGFIGNYCYIVKAEKEIQKVMAATTDEDERMFILRQTGGTSWVPFVLAGVAVLFLALGGPAHL